MDIKKKRADAVFFWCILKVPYAGFKIISLACIIERSVKRNRKGIGHSYAAKRKNDNIMNYDTVRLDDEK